MWDGNDVDSSHDDLIQDYLEGEATPAEEKRFRRLLADESFSRRVAQFAIDLGQLYGFVQQGMLRWAPRTEERTRLPVRWQLTAGFAVALVVLVVAGSLWRDALTGGRPPHSPPPAQSASSIKTPPLTSPPVRAPDSVACIVHVTGEVTRATLPGAQDARAVAVKTEIHSGEVLRTVGPGSFAVLEFSDGTVFAVAGDTELVCTVANGDRRVVVTRGDLMAQVKSRPGEISMVIETPVAEAEILGTKLSLFASSDLTELDVQEGEVRVTRRSDGRFIKVRTGEYVLASADSDLATQPLSNTTSLWEEDFEKGLPRRWMAGRLIHESLPSGSFGAVRAVPRRGVQGDPDGPFRIATAREWARGLFRVEEDTHLNFTYKLRFRGGFHIRLNTNADPMDPSTANTYEYRSRALRQVTRDQWRTVTVPLSDFSRMNGDRFVGPSADPPIVGNSVIMIGFGSPFGDRGFRDPGLVIDRIWITRGAAQSAEVLGEVE